MPLPVVSRVVAVPGWTLLAAAVVEPELTRPWGLCVLVCPPLPELIDKPIGLYCKAMPAKVYTKKFCSGLQSNQLPLAGFESHIANIHL